MRKREGRRGNGSRELSLSSSFLLVLILLVGVSLLGRPGFHNPSDLAAHPSLYLRDGEPLAVADVMLGPVGAPQRLSFACDDRGCRPIASPPREPVVTTSALFRGGRIDMTGDGVPEHVRLVGGRVVIHSDGAEVWSSPATWRVVDLALGDPNDDGRGEILLALWKAGLDGLETPSPEKERVPRSHPFIVGYRGGIYHTLWGGSAVGNPVHEVELGDVDGDGIQELVVLDGDEPQRRTVSVWRWHGWGFSLIWRSDPGAYRELSLSDNGTISVALHALPLQPDR